MLDVSWINRVYGEYGMVTQITELLTKTFCKEFTL